MSRQYNADRDRFGHEEAERRQEARALRAWQRRSHAKARSEAEFLWKQHCEQVANSPSSKAALARFLAVVNGTSVRLAVDNDDGGTRDNETT